MDLMRHLTGQTLVEDAQGRTHFLPWGLLNLVLPFVRTYVLPDEAAIRRARRLVAAYLALQFALVGVWLATGSLLPPGGHHWWALACVLPAPVFYLLGVARLTRALPPSSAALALHDRVRLAAARQHPAASWLQLFLCLGVLSLGVWVLGFDRTPVGILVGALLVLLGLSLGAWQLVLLRHHPRS